VILLASGDPFMIINEAGNGNTWSYTATADLVITSYANASAGDTKLGTWVSATSGMRYYLFEGNSGITAASNFNKVILLSGQTITMDNIDVNTNGNYIGGFEL
jgi:hypothetical protein